MGEDFICYMPGGRGDGGFGGGGSADLAQVMVVMDLRMEIVAESKLRRWQWN